MKSRQLSMRSLITMFMRATQATAFLLVVAQLPLGFAEELELENDQPKTLGDALFGGEVKLDLRIRAEYADLKGTDPSQAYTERLRLGYGSKKYNGFSFYAEIEDIRAVDDDRYNAAGTNSNTTKTNIADPEDTELNQAYVTYDWEETGLQFKVGRQRITLDDHRFIGNVGWRQNEQTYDALTIVSHLAEDMTLIYGYLWDINRVFGPDASLDLSSDSHALNLSFGNTRTGKLTVFGYHLDVDGQTGAAGLSSDTFGIRYGAKRPLEDGGSLEYVFSYARQVDAADNTNDYEADYVLAEVKLHNEGGMIGVGYEMLGSDDDSTGTPRSFSTPLATGHKFNGWADVFLTTPAKGLRDAYAMAGFKLPGNASAKVVYHWFWTDKGASVLGDELDFVFEKSLSDKTTVLAKYATYNGVGTAARTDIDRLWLQLEYKF